MVHRFSCSVACGILVPQPGIKPTSPVLQGGFLTTGPQWKSWRSNVLRKNYLFIICTKVPCRVAGTLRLLCLECHLLHLPPSKVLIHPSRPPSNTLSSRKTSMATPPPGFLQRLMIHNIGQSYLLTQESYCLM